MTQMRRIVLLGCTGSIGTQTLDVVSRLSPDVCRIVGLAARQNTTLLAEQARITGAKTVVLTDESRVSELQTAGLPDGTRILGGDASLIELATMPDADTVVVAVSGAAALSATLAAVRAGKRVCIATKEVLVSAGELIMDAARVSGAEILPVDSEHSAIWQCPARPVPRCGAMRAHHGVGRPLSHMDERENGRGDARRGTEPPDMAHGRQDNH